MYAFDYHRPSSVSDAVALLTGEATVLAGGQTLIPTLKQRLAQPSAVVDIRGIANLGDIVPDGTDISIGATARHADVANHDGVQGMIPALAALAGGIGDAQVRNMGTIGGSVANNDPAADYPAAVVGLNATVHTNSRQIAADDFFTGMFETALNDGEIITKIVFPKPEAAAYVKFPNPASRYAMVGVMVARTGGGVRVAVTGAGPCVFRASAMESALSGNFSAGALDGISIPADGMNADIHGSADYRAHLVGVMAKRAVAQAGG